MQTHTEIYSLLSPSLQSIPLDHPQTLLTVSLPPCCLEPHCFSSWISRARVVFIVPFFSDSWLSSCGEISSHSSSTLPVSLSAGMCVYVPCLSVCQRMGLKCLGVLLKWWRHHCLRVTAAPGFPWRLVYTDTYSSAGVSEQCLWLNSALHMFSFCWDTSKFPLLSQHLWFLGL